jgi:hypothetical protein
MTLLPLASLGRPFRSGRMLRSKWIGLFRLAASSLLSAAPEEGFEAIFDGTLKNWEGDPTYWRAENGVLMAEVKDEDPEKQRMTGLLGVQVHVGPPMKIEYRNIRVRKLSGKPLDHSRSGRPCREWPVC